MHARTSIHTDSGELWEDALLNVVEPSKQGVEIKATAVDHECF